MSCLSQKISKQKSLCFEFTLFALSSAVGSLDMIIFVFEHRVSTSSLITIETGIFQRPSHENNRERFRGRRGEDQ